MPTGYTAKIYEGKPQTRDEFILDCARAFGALIEMRDQPIGAEIPQEFAPDTRYHDEQLADAQARLDEAATLTMDQCADRADADYRKELAYRKDVREKNATLRKRYLAMRADVERWVPPTDDHVELKKFMLDQLDRAMEFDCSGPFGDEPQLIGPEAWRAEHRRKAIHDFEYHTGRRREEIERAEKRTVWVRLLRESLRTPEPAASR